MAPLLRNAAIEGVGVSLLPTFLVARDLLDGRLISIDVGAVPDTDTIAGVFPRAHRGMPRLRAFLDHLQAAFGDPPPWDRELAAAGFISLD